MITEETILISLCVICAFALIYIFYGINIDALKINSNKRLMRRFDDVYKYRRTVINKDLQAYCGLPTFKEMLYSDKPLEDEYWINK